MGFEWYDIIGYIGTAIVILSFALSGEKKIRIVNIIGCGISLAYAIILLVLTKSGIPVIVLNGSLVLIHIFYLTKGYIKGKKEVEEGE